jgi:predicted phosphodiesterase
VKPKQVYVVGLGDLVEGCDGHYASQTFTVELNRREQVRVVRRLFRDFVIKLAGLGVPVVVSAVAGNHGENRKDGKAFTGVGDNDDVAVVEQVAEVLQSNPDAFGHVSFHIPDDRLSVLLEIEGWRVGFNHGHVAGKGSTPQQKQQNWWKDHAFMLSPIGDADYLVTGHYHHLSVVDHGPRVHFQAPAMDGGSKWFEDRGGGVSATGTLTFMIYQQGWDNLRIL